MAKLKEILVDDLAKRDDYRKTTSREGDLYRIPLDKIRVRKGFNVRTEMGDLEGLAASILESGQTMPGRVDAMVDGTYILTDGHRRFEAMKLLQKQGHEPLMKVIINPRATTEEERILQMFTSQDNKQLEPHEAAEVIRRLMNLGYDQTQVAAKIGKPAHYVSRLLAYSLEPEAVKKEVRAGKLSVSGALEIRKAIPSTEARIEAVSAAAARGPKIVAAEVAGRVNHKERVRQLEALLQSIVDEVSPEVAEKINAVL